MLRLVDTTLAPQQKMPLDPDVFINWSPCLKTDIHSKNMGKAEAEELANRINAHCSSLPPLARTDIAIPLGKKKQGVPNYIVLIDWKTLSKEWIDAIPGIENLKALYLTPDSDIKVMSHEDIVKHNLRFLDITKEELEAKLNRQLASAQKYLDKKVYELGPSKSPRKLKTPEITLQNNYHLVNGPHVEDARSLKRVCIATTKGNYRPMMEDVAIHKDLLIKQGKQNLVIPFYAIFDGHAGQSTAIHLGSNLPDYLVSELSDKLIEHPDRGHIDLYNVLKTACVELGREAFGQKPHNPSGSTATFALMIEDHLWVANTGDSRAVLFTEPVPVILSEDADLEDKKYQRGVWKRGGHIACYGDGQFRVNGLNMARSAGHNEIYDGVNPRATIIRYPLKELPAGMNKLVIASDGIWAVLSPNQAGAIIRKRTAEGQNGEQIAHELILEALKRGSTDNISVLIVDLDRFS